MSSNVSNYALKKTETLFRTRSEEDGEWVVWRVRRFRVEENLGQPYYGTVEIVTLDLKTQAVSLAGAECVLEIDRGLERRRRFAGLVTKITDLGDQEKKNIAQVHFAPAICALDYGINTRTFEDLTSARIVESVLKEGLKTFYRPIKTSLKTTQVERLFCVQHEESDLAFISRIMAEEGMFYFFEQEENHEVVVVVDATESCPEMDSMGYDGDALGETREEMPEQSFAAEGSTYSDVTRRQHHQESEPKIRFISPDKPSIMVAIIQDSGVVKPELLEVVTDAPGAQSVLWKVKVTGKIKNGKSGIQPHQEGEIIKFQDGAAECESKIVDGKAMAALFCGETDGVKLAIEASVEGATPANCEVEVFVDLSPAVHNKLLHEALKDIPPKVYRKDGKVHVVIGGVTGYGGSSDRLGKALQGCFDEVLAQCDGFKLMWHNDLFWRERRDFPKNVKNHGRYLQLVAYGTDHDDEIKLSLNLKDYVTGEQVEYNSVKAKEISKLGDFDSTVKSLAKKALEGLQSIMAKYPGTV